MTLEESFRYFNLPYNASLDEINEMKKTLLLKYHPDRFQDETSKEMAKEKTIILIKAYKIIMDSKGQDTLEVNDNRLILSKFNKLYNEEELKGINNLLQKLHEKHEKLSFEKDNNIYFYDTNPDEVEKACRSYSDIDSKGEIPLFCINFDFRNPNSHGILISNKHLYCCNTWEKQWCFPLYKINELKTPVGIFKDIIEVNGKNSLNFPIRLNITSYRELINYAIELLNNL